VLGRKREKVLEIFKSLPLELNLLAVLSSRWVANSVWFKSQLWSQIKIALHFQHLVVKTYPTLVSTRSVEEAWGMWGPDNCLTIKLTVSVGLYQPSWLSLNSWPCQCLVGSCLCLLVSGRCQAA
jgi:hypothetical protein